MGLYNPLLNNIPQPKNNSKEVAWNSMPQSNYKAAVTTPLVNELYITTLETEGTETATANTTSEVVLTNIFLQGIIPELLASPGETASVDIYLNSVKIFSINYQDFGAADKVTEYRYNIPLENVSFNGQFKMVAVHSSAYAMKFNCSFIGYKATKQ